MENPLIRILILGYYNQNNLGDDLFTKVFQEQIFDDQSKYTLRFLNLNEIKQDLLAQDHTNYDLVIIGGGDLLNDHFFYHQVTQIISNYSSHGVPVYFLGVGITYPDTIGILDLGDKFFLRNHSDYLVANQRFGECAREIPDLGFFCQLPDLKVKLGGVKQVGLSLPQTWLHSTARSLFKGEYRKIMVRDICSIITDLIKTGVKVHLIPFDTSSDPSNSDLELSRAVKKNLHESVRDRVIFIESRLSVKQTIEYINEMDVMLASRFHSVVLSSLCATPFVSLYTTEKIRKLARDCPPALQKYFIKLETDESGIPKGLPVNRVLNLVRDLLCNEQSRTISQILSDLTSRNKKALADFKRNLLGIDFPGSVRTTPPTYISAQDTRTLITDTIRKVIMEVNKKATPQQIDRVLRGDSLLRVLPDQGSMNLASLRVRVTEEILYNITGDPMSPYYYGLYNNVFESYFLKQLEWIVADYYSKYKYTETPSNIRIINKNFQDIHRSGWQYIVDNIVANGKLCDTEITVDTYVDKTFHWNRQFYLTKGILPYSKPWVGFIHHTFSNYNNNYNCRTLFIDPLFLQSLASCKCLIVLSEYLKQQIEEVLVQIGFEVPVISLVHPTEVPDQKFEWKRFIDNDNRRIIQVGNWLRDVFAIYKLQLLKSSVVGTKAVLKNKNSDNYFPPPNFIEDLKKSLGDTPVIPGSANDMCRISVENMFVKGLLEDIVKTIGSVEVIEHLTNESYDELLSENLVFLNLVDASAVNTVIECAVRATPLLVNKLPAVVEILGDQYPLYYEDLTDASVILKNTSLIKSAHEYLCKIDKTALLLYTFTQSFTVILRDL
jgi:hypothetical protein